MRRPGAGLLAASFLYFDETGKGAYALYRSQGAGFSGGVTFKNSGWTAYERTRPAKGDVATRTQRHPGPEGRAGGPGGQPGAGQGTWRNSARRR